MTRNSSNNTTALRLSSENTLDKIPQDVLENTISFLDLKGVSEMQNISKSLNFQVKTLLNDSKSLKFNLEIKSNHLKEALKLIEIDEMPTYKSINSLFIFDCNDDDIKNLGNFILYFPSLKNIEFSSMNLSNLNLDLRSFRDLEKVIFYSCRLSLSNVKMSNYIKEVHLKNSHLVENSMQIEDFIEEQQDFQHFTAPRNITTDSLNSIIDKPRLESLNFSSTSLYLNEQQQKEIHSLFEEKKENRSRKRKESPNSTIQEPSTADHQDRKQRFL
jgi:hypothetical protein